MNLRRVSTLRVAHALPTAIAACAVFGFLGCASVTTPGVRITEDRFVREAPENYVEAPWAAQSTPSQILAGEFGFDPALGEAGVYDITVAPGPPELAPQASGVAAPILLDAKVGEVNGVPIYASTFFAEMGPRLRAEAARKTQAEWMRDLDAQIRARLDELVRGVLLTGEMRSQLTPRQRQGLANFLEQFQSDVASANYGSRTLVDARLAEERGLTLEELIQQKEDEVLISLAMDKLRTRTRVSEADVRREYARQEDRFNPPPTARLWIIRVPNTDEAGIAEVAAALEGGAAFIDVANLPVNRSRNAGLQELTFRGEWVGAELFGAPALNTAARSLTEGQWTGPFALGAETTAWIFLEGIHSESIPYYEAQAVLREEIAIRRYNEELGRYLMRLKRGANEMDEAEIIARLRQYAVEHFWRR